MPRSSLVYRIASFTLFAVFGCTTANATSAIDYAREERWAAEVVPSLVAGDAVYLSTSERARVLAILTPAAGESKGAVVVVHGLGVHPDFGISGALRTKLADAGYTTLAVQMPVLPAGASREDYGAAMPQAGSRIAAAIAFFSKQGATRIAIVSHSLGSAMVNAYLAQSDALPIDAWIPIGMFGPFAAAPKQPVLDVVAEEEIAPVRETAPARIASLRNSQCSRQVTIAGADHYFERKQSDLVARIADFLASALAGNCKGTGNFH